jgi:hypothetical protein
MAQAAALAICTVWAVALPTDLDGEPLLNYSERFVNYSVYILPLAVLFFLGCGAVYFYVRLTAEKAARSKLAVKNPTTLINTKRSATYALPPDGREGAEEDVKEGAVQDRASSEIPPRQLEESAMGGAGEAETVFKLGTSNDPEVLPDAIALRNALAHILADDPVQPVMESAKDQGCKHYTKILIEEFHNHAYTLLTHATTIGRSQTWRRASRITSARICSGYTASWRSARDRSCPCALVVLIHQRTHTYTRTFTDGTDAVLPRLALRPPPIERP